MACWRLIELWLALAVSSRSTPRTADALSSVRLHFVRIGQHRFGNACSAWTASPQRLRADNNCRPDNGGLFMSDSSASAASASQTSPSWSKLTVPQLKSQLKQWNLPVSGVKAELIRRIEEHQQESSSSSSATNDSKRTAITTHERENNQPTTTNNGKRRSISFPPPKDETEVRVLEKEVHETIRMLEGLKLGGMGSPADSGSSADSQQQQQRQLSRQQKQEKELMESLKQSLKGSQQRTTKSSAPPPSDTAAAASTPPLPSTDRSTLEEHIERLRPRPANALKAELSSLRLSTKGRKPDLVDRLARHYVSMDADADGCDADDKEDEESHETEVKIPDSKTSSGSDGPVTFAGIPRLSPAAADAFHRAFGEEASLEPTPIQAAAVPKIFYPPNPSALLHAPTGSGKTIAYLLPITETLWREVDGDGSGGRDVDPNDMANGMALVLLPTRELAAQVAGVATVLAPPGTVRLVPHPTDLMGFWKDSVDRGEEYDYFENEGDEGNGNEGANGTGGRKYHPRILVGSAKSVSASLFGDGKMPGTPTSKPEGKKLLGSVRWLVMDEADRLLNVKKGRTDKKSRRHEKPTAMLAAAVARLTLGRVQVVAASATVGRPLRRELSRVLGLHSSECPETIRGEEDAARMERRTRDDDEKHVGRAVRIPNTVRNYVLPVDGTTAGSLLTSAAFACKTILPPPQDSDGMSSSGRKVLLVLTRACDIKVHNALGALRHFGIRPEPQSLLDALGADGTDRLVEAHRKVSGVEGVGGTRQRNGKRSDTSAAKVEDEGYLLVTHEDNVRGLHLDGLDAVVVVGRPGSPDEYTHIAGRTGRAGRPGSVLNVVGYEQAAALSSWTKMLG
eukprot:CAMPEP_0181115074 /NCGR_PEP_ID=MMETSP1071-20121207/21239_1 /TAXON_ID=35127 /ORGANISM="Thalassiosira sp., Strain NH16" /LENGTH=851 /DNA_ID=CAMNT_0023199259 /DNA_START=73 /DNA_END=2624 /DNA_ORIENTATION=+